MAEIVEGPQEWSAVIRCAVPRCYGTFRVDGCFAQIRITLDDLKVSRDWEGDVSCTTECPSCGTKIHPKWQIGDGPIDILLKRQGK